MATKYTLIYCYETKEQFSSVAEAAKKYNIKQNKYITQCMNKPNGTAGGYHWCTDLSIFDGVKLNKPVERITTVYCYETKEKFDGISDALKKTGIKGIFDVLDDPNSSVGGYHWCTDLSVFDGVELNRAMTKVVTYCYETKERFNSVSAAAKHYNTTFNNIYDVLDKPNRTACSLHWCTSLDKFDNIFLSGGSTPVPRVIYCYETKEKFDSINSAQTKYNLHNQITDDVIDNPNRTAGSYHWCTSLDKFDGVTLTCRNQMMAIVVYCYETKEKFDSINQASKLYDITFNTLAESLDNPNRTAGSYHWCTSLDKFDGVTLTSGQDLVKIPVYNYETKEKFDSIAEAKTKYNVGNINQILNDPNRTAGKYHWCTSLDIFDGIKLSSGQDLYKVPVYNYETKEKFDSIAEAQTKYNLHNQITDEIINNPNRTAGGYHWCTSLDIFDKIKEQLTSGKDLYKVPVYNYETKEKFDSLTDAQIKYNLYNLYLIIDNPNRTAGNYHWCTSLDIFDGVDLIYPDSGISSQEKEIVDFIKSIYNKEVIENSRSIISPYELDIYLPDLKLAFEFNGDYWHSEAKGKDKNYHINKTNLCKDKNIQLIHIFEYQYRENPVIIKSMIMNKLNKNPIKLYARNCKIMQVSKDEAELFLNDNHIQGYVNSDVNIGLYCNNVLVSIMTFGKSRFDKSIEYELLRYACLKSTNVIGGASKLLKYFEKIYKPKSLISYADISYSNGNLYDKLGFNFIGISDPDYINIKNNIVYSRYQTMKHKLPKLLGEENFDINLTEQQNLDNNGYFRVWRCGNLKYLKEYNYNE